MGGEPKKEEKGFWGKAWDVVTWPARKIWNAVTSPPRKKSCFCRFFDFLSDTLGYVLLLMIEVWLLLFIVYVIFSLIVGAISAIPGVVVPGAIAEAIATFGEILFSVLWFWVLVAVAILWGIAAFIAYVLC